MARNNEEEVREEVEQKSIQNIIPLSKMDVIMDAIYDLNMFGDLLLSNRGGLDERVVVSVGDAIGEIAEKLKKL